LKNNKISQEKNTPIGNIRRFRKAFEIIRHAILFILIFFKELEPIITFKKSGTDSCLKSQITTQHGLLWAASLG
jgi:hypothetical protein